MLRKKLAMENIAIHAYKNKDEVVYMPKIFQEHIEQIEILMNEYKSGKELKAC